MKFNQNLVYVLHIGLMIQQVTDILHVGFVNQFVRQALQVVVKGVRALPNRAGICLNLALLPYLPYFISQGREILEVYFCLQRPDISLAVEHSCEFRFLHLGVEASQQYVLKVLDLGVAIFAEVS